MSEPGELGSWPGKLRLNELPRDRDGRIVEAKRVEAVERLTGTLIDQTWQQNGSYVDPVVTVYVDDTFIYCRLVAVEEEPWVAARWRNESFDATKYRQNVEHGMRKGIEAYEHKAHDTGFMVDREGLHIMAQDRLGARKPQRV